MSNPTKSQRRSQFDPEPSFEHLKSGHSAAKFEITGLRGFSRRPVD
jgi:hypothetical protein